MGILGKAHALITIALPAKAIGLAINDLPVDVAVVHGSVVAGTIVISGTLVHDLPLTLDQSAGLLEVEVNTVEVEDTRCRRLGLDAEVIPVVIDLPPAGSHLAQIQITVLALGRVKDQAGELLSGDTTDIKKQAAEIGKKIMPDSLDDKVDDVVNTAVDFLKDTFGKK